MLTSEKSEKAIQDRWSLNEREWFARRSTGRCWEKKGKEERKSVEREREQVAVDPSTVKSNRFWQRQVRRETLSVSGPSAPSRPRFSLTSYLFLSPLFSAPFHDSPSAPLKFSSSFSLWLSSFFSFSLPFLSYLSSPTFSFLPFLSSQLFHVVREFLLPGTFFFPKHWSLRHAQLRVVSGRSGWESWNEGRRKRE